MKPIHLLLGLLTTVACLFLFYPKAKQYLTGERRQVIDINNKHPNDKRHYRAITLENKLEIMLISDETMNKSAAAMDVGVGSLEDPKEHLGLAHFLEHMLFLGTKKYPDVEEYNKYLHAHQGSSNAYTAAENTNYHFEVNHSGFEGSLDRFAQFFIDPLFNPEFVERELNAVNSEHQKNLNDDYWRTRMILRHLHKDGHPRQKFSTGDLKTLAKVDRKTLVDFYKSRYSANIMKLVLLSKESLDNMEAMARKYFSAVANHDFQRPKYDQEIFDKNELPRIVGVKPVKNIKKLSLLFPAPADHPYWQSKPSSLISHLIGHEGEGSLLSALKEENLASGLSAWLESSSYAGLFHFDISLTDHGVEAKDRVIELFFSYVNMLKSQDLKEYLYQERKVMADINFVYRDLKEGSQVASHYASRMHEVKALDIDKSDLLYHKYSQEDFALFLSAIDPSKLHAMFTSETVEGKQTELHYGSQYEVKKFSDELIKKWSKAQTQVGLSLPKPNEFIPQNLDLITANTKTQAKKIIDNDWGQFWFQLDDTFKLPKGHVQLVLLTPKTNNSPKAKVLSLLYSLAIQEGLNEWNYDISLAGLHYSVSRIDRGIQLDFSGYSDNLNQLMVSLVTKLKQITIDQKRLDIIKDDLKRSIANSNLDVAYQQLMYELKNLTAKNLIHRNKLYSEGQNGQTVDLISNISLEELKNYTSSLFNEIAIEGSAYGNLNEIDLKNAVEAYYTKLDAKVLPVAKRPENDTIKLSPGSSKAMVLTTNSNNHCWGSNLQLGKRDPKLNAAIRVAHSHLKTSFFGDLRTKQQLGYIVYSGLNYQEKSLGMLFLIQSSKYSPFEIAKRVKIWKETALEELTNLADDKFEAYKKSAAAELRELDKTMGERHQTIIFEALIMNGSFNYKEKIAQQVEALTKEDMIKVFSDNFSPDKEAALSVYLKTNGTEANKTDEELITDEQEFKTNMPIF